MVDIKNEERQKDFTDFARLTHSGKYGVVYDVAYSDNGDLYYASMGGPKQMCEGIAAALLDSGKRNKNSVFLNIPLDGENGVWSRSLQVRIADNTIGAMRRKTRKVQGQRAWQVVLSSHLVKWDYNYAHINKKNALEESEDSDYDKGQKELALRRFILMADEGEDPEVTAERWFGFLPMRVSEPLLHEWAKPLWDYCEKRGQGLTKLSRLRGKAWLCEPAPAVLRSAISHLGKKGELYLPDAFPAEMREMSGDLAVAAG